MSETEPTLTQDERSVHEDVIRRNPPIAEKLVEQVLRNDRFQIEQVIDSLVAKGVFTRKSGADSLVYIDTEYDPEELEDEV